MSTPTETTFHVPVPKPKRHWKAATAVGVVALILGTAVGVSATDGQPAPSAAPLPAITKTVEVPGPTVTETVEVPGPAVTKTIEVPGPTATPDTPNAGATQMDEARPYFEAAWEGLTPQGRADIRKAWNSGQRGQDLVVDGFMQGSDGTLSRSVVRALFAEVVAAPDVETN